MEIELKLSKVVWQLLNLNKIESHLKTLMSIIPKIIRGVQMNSSNQPNLLLNNTIEIIAQGDRVAPRFFAQTSSHWRSQSYLIQFKRLASENDHESLKKILTDLYFNYALLTKEQAINLFPAWIKCLNDYRQLSGTNHINRLLATGILMNIDKAHYEQLKSEFKGLLSLNAQQWPLLANSVLAGLAMSEQNDSLYTACKNAHNIDNLKKFLLHLNNAHSLNSSMNDLTIIITPFIQFYKEQSYFHPVLHAAESTISIHAPHYYQFLSALVKIIPENHILLKKTY